MTEAEVWRPAKKQVVRTSGAGAAKSVLAASNAGQLDLSPAAQSRRTRNGLPIARRPETSFWKRLLRNHYAWLTAAFTLFYLLLTYLIYRSFGRNLIAEISRVTSEVGSPVLISWSALNEALLLCAGKALPTTLCFLAAFILLDRIRPTPWSMKWIAFGWGASVAVYVSLILNTWAGALMNAQGPVDPSQGARSAIYSAPFVEESAKLTVVFWLAILLRRRLVSVHQLVTTAGLSAIGFAFVENIVYYAREYIFAANMSGENPNEKLDSIVLMRGLVTAFGHPLFTSIAALGFVVGLLNRSKLVRFLAPVVGFLVSVFGHMMFNGLMSVGFSVQKAAIFGWLAMLVLVVYLCFRYVHQLRNVRSRLSDFVRAGWLSQADPIVYSNLLARFKICFVGLLSGPRVARATWGVMRDITELAYLRDAEVRGLVDAWGLERQQTLMKAITKKRARAITDHRGLRWIPENIRSFFRNIVTRIKGWFSSRPPAPPVSQARIPQWQPPQNPNAPVFRA